MKLSDQFNHLIQVATGNSVSSGVAAGTVAAGTMTLLAQVQSWFSVIALAVGALLSIVLIRKHLIETKKIQRELEILNEETEAGQ